MYNIWCSLKQLSINNWWYKNWRKLLLFRQQRQTDAKYDTIDEIWVVEEVGNIIQ